MPPRDPLGEEDALSASRRLEQGVEPLRDDDVDVEERHRLGGVRDGRHPFEEMRRRLDRRRQHSRLAGEEVTLVALKAAIEQVDRLIVIEKPQRIHKCDRAEKVA